MSDYSARYDPDRDFDRWYTALTARRILPALAPGSLVLELGSATGMLTQAITGAGRRIVCVERSARYVARARARALPGVEVVHAEIEAFEPGGDFDHLLALNVLHEVPDQAGLLRRLAGVMTGVARLHVTLPNPCSLHRLSALGAGMIGDLREPSARGRAFGTVGLQHAAAFVDAAAGAGLAEVAREAILVKPLPNAGMERLSDAVIEAYDALAHALPGHGAMTYFVFRRADG